jgi:hypothetical protein
MRALPCLLAPLLSLVLLVGCGGEESAQADPVEVIGDADAVEEPHTPSDAAEAEDAPLTDDAVVTEDADATAETGGADATDATNATDTTAADGEADTKVDALVAAVSVVISEVMIPAHGTGPPYIELYNPGPSPVDLTGCALSDEGGSSLILPGLTVASAGYVVLVGTEGPDYTFWFTSLDDEEIPDLSFSADTLGVDAPDDEVLLTCEGALIDRVAWTDYAPAEPNNPMQSLTLDPDHMDAQANDDPDNWCRASTYFNFSSRGTPRRPNDACPP